MMPTPDRNEGRPRRQVQPTDLLYAPKRYPQPDYEAIGTVSRVWVPDEETVGWIVLQGDARLAWLSASGAENLGDAIRLHVDELLREYAAEDRAALDAWAAVLRVTLHTTPTDQYLPALLADIRSARNLDH